MKRIVQALNALNIPVVPIETDKAQTCLVYQWYQTSFFNYRLELRLIASSFKEAEQLAPQVMDILNDFGDNNKIEGIASIDLNGGGSMKDYENNTIQRLFYFDVIMK